MVISDCLLPAVQTFVLSGLKGRKQKFLFQAKCSVSNCFFYSWLCMFCSWEGIWIICSWKLCKAILVESKNKNLEFKISKTRPHRCVKNCPWYSSWNMLLNVTCLMLHAEWRDFYEGGLLKNTWWGYYGLCWNLCGVRYVISDTKSYTKNNLSSIFNSAAGVALGRHWHSW